MDTSTIEALKDGLVRANAAMARLMVREKAKGAERARLELDARDALASLALIIEREGVL